MDPAAREPWDFGAFMRAYNGHADEFGGWHFDVDGVSQEELRRSYETTALWDSVADFARTRFQLDQQI